MKMIQRFENAKKVIGQIRSGEWVPYWNDISREHLTARRDGLRLWLGSGPWFCEIEEGVAFGLLWRHWVWWAAARRLKINADAVKEIVI